MINMILAELYKLKYSVTLYVCLLLAVALAVVGVIVDASATAIIGFESAAGNLSVFLAIIVSSIACDDYESNTMKNIISSGNSRWHIYSGKLVAALIIGVIYFLVDGFATCITAYICNGLGTQISPLAAMESLAAQLLLITVFVTTFFGISAIAKNSKTGLILSIVFSLFVAIVPWAIGNYITHTDLSSFSLDTLTKNIEALNFSSQMIINFAIYGGFSIFLNWLGYLRFKKEEV